MANQVKIKPGCDHNHHRLKTQCTLSRQLALLLLILWINIESISCKKETIYTNTFAVQIKPPFGDDDAHQLAQQHGFINHGKIGSLDDHYLLEHHSISKRSADHSHEHHSKLKTDPRVLWVEQQVVKKRVKRGFQDVTQTISDPLFKEQWYINKGARDGYDMNVFGAWQKGFTGKGVVVTILDDGIQPNHPDLEGNYDSLASFDVNGNDPDPTPQDNGDNKHGTRCAGEVAAIAGNDICGVGIAFNSSIGGVRMLDGIVTDEVEARALGLNPNHIDIYSASWGPEDDGKTVDGPGRLAKRAFIDGIKKGRRGKGSIFVWASGNGGRRDDNCNCDGYTNSIYTLSISSATQSGAKPWYLEECSSTLATTYSSGSIGRDQNIVTVDMDTSYFESLVKGLPGDASRLCTKSHTGTSASAPIAAAICALALEANPNLTWRDMQHVVVMTSRYEPLKAEPGWFANGIGRNVSHKFGYGLMDAEAMVKLAERWRPLPPQIICETPVHEERLVIPASTSSQLEVSLNWTGCSATPGDIKYLEHVQTRVYLQFTPRGSLKISLMSPSGTVSNLLTPRVKDMTDTAFEQWPFLSVHFWGENPRGTWKLIIKNDLSPVDKPGQLISWGMTFYGISEPIPSYEDSSRSVRFLPRRVMATKCPKSMFLNLESNECVKDCPDGYFGHVETVECTKCNSQCSTCYGPSPDNCITCDKGYYYFADRCLKQCPEGYFADNQLEECLPCSQNCKTCQTSPSQCTSCPDSFKLDPTSSKCFSVCKSSHCNPCPKNCVSCSSPLLSSSSSSSRANDDTCNLCKNGFKLFNGICSTESCPRDHYEQPLDNSQSSECRKCHESCETCFGPSHTQCQSCLNNSPLKDGLCLPCPRGEFFNPQTKSCDLCHESCLACSGSSSADCIECRMPLFLESNRCVPCCSKVQASSSSSPASSSSSSPLLGSKLSEKSNQINNNADNIECCQCESPIGPCVVPERPRSISSFVAPPAILGSSSAVNGDSPFKGKFLLRGLVKSPSTVIFVICFSSLFLFVIIFIVLQLIASPEAGLFSRKSYRRYKKISNFASYRHSQEKISLTCDDLDDEEDRLFEKT